MTERFKFCLWLLDKLSRGRMTFREISDEWDRASVNDKRTPLTPRSFLRYRNTTEELFNVNIDCYKPKNEYFLDTTSMEEIDRWTLSALRLQNLSSMAELRKVIMLEPPPAGSELVRQLAEACKDGKLVSTDYKSHYQEIKHHTIIPLFLRLFKQRWYLTGQYPGSERYITMMLERMSNIEIGGESVANDTEAASPEEFFKDCYGVIRQHEPIEIIIRAFWPQDKYLMEVPIHPSQKVIAETPNWTDFSLYVRPTYDFKQELLWHRDKLTVLSPASFREDMIDILERMLKSYQTGQCFSKDE